ncbi:MAG: LysM peptidoglycan-binding domain-containing protein, partial [Vicinamibacterales bacterium]
QLGTKDMGVIAERYESRTFGFASRNFYAEFLAAFTVYADRETLFPGVEALAPVTFDAFEPGAYVSLLDLAYLTGTDVAQLTALNPALHPDVSRGVLLVPAKYPLRVPSGTEDAFEDALDRLPDSRKRERQLSATYRVRRGDTVGAIARRYGTTPTAIQRANGLSRPDRIYVGQVLEVGTGGSWTPLVWTGTARVTNVQATLSPAPAAHASAGGSEGARTHVVRRGETLTRIAARYGVSVPAIAGANSLRSVNRIRPGMRLDIPD